MSVGKSTATTAPGRDFDLGASDDLLGPGDELGRYRIRGLVGVGGMGRVYRAWDPELAREVALKLVLTGNRGPEGVARLRREARAMARLNHPNVLPVYGVAEDPAGTYIVMEFVHGATLSAWGVMQSDWKTVVRVHAQAARGLEAAHAAGLVHRDYKPQNVLVGDDGRVRVMDFGLARESTTDEETLPPGEGPLPVSDVLTGANQVVGTPLYMAPEQHEGQPPNPRSDQYAFCLCLWEDLFGKRPFGTQHLEQVKRRGPPEPPADRGGVPLSIVRALRRGMQPSPGDRWPTMAAVLEEIERPLRPRWGRRVSAAGIVMIVGGVLALMSVDSGSTSCDPASIHDQLDWTPQARAEIVEAMQRDGWDPNSVVERIDGVAARWTEASAGQCEARRAGAAPDETGWACLSRVRRQIDATTRVLANSHGADFARALELVGRVEEPSSCADGSDVELSFDAPGVDGVASRVAVARALERAGRLDDALEEIEPALVEARRLEHPVLTARALVVRCHVNDELDRIDVASEACQEAYSVAMRSGDGQSARAAALRLAVIEGVRNGRTESAREWLRQVEALMQRDGIPETEPGYAGTRADVLTAAAHRDEALVVLQQALQAHPDPTELSAIQLRHKLAIVLSGLGRHGDARRELDAVAAMAEQQLGETHPVVAALENSRAVAAMEQADYDAAALRYEHALAILDRLEDDGLPAIQIRFNLAQVEAGRGRYERADAELAAIHDELEDRLGEGHPMLAVVAAAQGHNALQQDDAEAAERYTVQALEMFRARSAELDPRYALTLATMAAVRVFQGRAEDAIHIAEKALQLHAQAGRASSRDAAWAYNILGTAQAEAGRVEDARRSFESAIEIFDGDALAVHGLAEVRFRLALTYGSSEHPRARRLAEEALEAFLQVGEGYAGDVASIEAWLRGESPGGHYEHAARD